MPAARASEGAEVAGGSVVFKGPTGRTVCELAPKTTTKDKAFRLRDGQGKPLGTVKVQADRVKLKDPEDKEVLKIKRKPYGAEIEDSTGARLYRVHADGPALDLEDKQKTLVARVAPGSGGFEITDGKGEVLARVKGRRDKLVLEAKDGRSIGTIEGTSKTRAGATLALEALGLAERAALFAYYLEVER
jgi:hypothetical protein